MSVVVHILILMIAVLPTSAQSYYGEYIDSLRITNKSEVTASLRQSLESQNVPPQIIDSYIEQFFSKEEDFTIVQRRSMQTRNDTAFVSLEVISAPKFATNLNDRPNKFIVINGWVRRVDQSGNLVSATSLTDSVGRFVAAGRTKEILGLECKEFQSIDGIYKIWVAPSLPSIINPGVNVKNVSGAILRFEARQGNGSTVSQIVKLKN